jgi:hypothetical protein
MAFAESSDARVVGHYWTAAFHRRRDQEPIGRVAILERFETAGAGRGTVAERQRLNSRVAFEAFDPRFNRTIERDAAGMRDLEKIVLGAA